MLSLILTHAVPSLYARTVHTMQAAWHVRVGMRVDIHADEACEITQNTVYRIYTVGIRYS